MTFGAGYGLVTIIKIFFGCKASVSQNHYIAPIKNYEICIFHPSIYSTVLLAPPPKFQKKISLLDFRSLTQYGDPDCPPFKKRKDFYDLGVG